MCDGSHEHGIVKTEQQHWTWRFAQAFVDGVAHLKTAIARGITYQFPGAATSSTDPECIACKRHLVRTDPSHTRDPAHCKFPDVEPIVYDCDACRRGLPLMHPTHTGVPGECRTADVRRRAGKPRAGRHPREPQVPSLDDPAADLQQQLPGNLGDLGAGEEIQAT